MPAVAAVDVERVVVGLEAAAGDNTLHVFSVDGGQVLGPAPKTELADELLDLVAARLA